MCGKFTAMKSWRQVVEFARAFSSSPADEPVTYRVMQNIPLIVLDRQSGGRKVMAARWGFPHPKDWKRPQPIHARAESIETTKAFAAAFLDGQRGIALVNTFCEAPDLPGAAQQHVITPGDETAVGIAFVWRSFDVGLPEPLIAACMVTVAANTLISGLPTDRMPAILEAGDWATWLGERDATVDEIKACLRTREEPSWTMAREEKPRRKPTVSDPGGVL
jgi:putative SOS response-associated peptidase YedK